ncbi:STAS domain-containing protein [Streptomyces longisporoflavus]|uniref:STAS domain-containing protein n=1 Tax=Streptomyces longisporoflavus TaxID=28044 RepID=A0ABW7QHP9_9ACTN
MFPLDNTLEVRPQGRIVVVTLRHEIDLQDADAVTEAFQRARTHSGTDATLLDLAALTFADSTLLGLILQTKAEHEQARRPLALSGPFHPGIQRLLDLTGAATVLPLAGTRDEGLRQLHTLLSTAAHHEAH